MTTLLMPSVLRELRTSGQEEKDSQDYLHCSIKRTNHVMEILPVSLSVYSSVSPENEEEASQPTNHVMEILPVSLSVYR